MSTIRAVTFDFWDTLVGEDQTRMRALQLEGWRRVLHDAGVEVSSELLAEAFAENWREFERRWAANEGQHTPADATDLICARLGVRADGARADLVEVFRTAGEAAPLRPAPDAARTLSGLRAAGIRLGIVCDVGMTPSPTLRGRLRGFGLLGYFDAWAFSDETGWFKPASQAFEPALVALGVGDPAEAAHVGDSRRTDVAGATALGMTAIRFSGFREDPVPNGPEASHVVASIAEIPALLGSR